MSTFLHGAALGALLVLLASPSAARNYDVARYDIALRFVPESKSFSGSVTATGMMTGDSLALDASLQLLTVDSVYWNGAPAAFRRSGDALIIPAAERGGSRQFTVRVVYRGISGFGGSYDAGGVLFTKKDGFDRIATISEPNFARTWWPCNDAPGDKAVVSLTVTVPADLRAVSNGVEAERRREGPWATYRWESRYPISTYLVAVAAARYEEITAVYRRLDGREMPVAFYVYPADTARARNEFANLTGAIGFFASVFGEYPFAEEKFAIAVVDGDMTMENQTICTVEASLVTGDRKNELTYIHELAHHWWGNLVTPSDWTQTWLSEGFATYAEALYLEHTRGREIYQTYIDNMMALPQGSYAGSVIGQSDTSFWDSFAPRVYYKSAIVLHMLRSLMGDSAFRTALRSYLHDEALRYRSAVTADFVRHCEAAHGSSLGWFFSQWITAKTDSVDRPALSYAWRRLEASSSELVVEQTTAPQLLYRLPLEVDVLTESGPERFSVVDSLPRQIFRFETSAPPTGVRIDPERKVFTLLSPSGGE